MGGKVSVSLKWIGDALIDAGLFLLWGALIILALGWFAIVWIPIAVILFSTCIIVLLLIVLVGWATGMARRRQAAEYWRARMIEERLRERQEAAAREKYAQDKRRGKVSKVRFT